MVYYAILGQVIGLIVGIFLVWAINKIVDKLFDKK